MKHIVISLLGISLISIPVSAWAAKAPVSAEELRKQADHIVSGKVIRVTARTEKSKVERAWGIHRDRVYTITLTVETVAKGSGVNAGDDIEVRAWEPARRIPPLPGSQGHESIPGKGDTITVHLLGVPGEVLAPILPNGIAIDKKAD